MISLPKIQSFIENALPHNTLSTWTESASMIQCRDVIVMFGGRYPHFDHCSNALSLLMVHDLSLIRPLPPPGEQLGIPRDKLSKIVTLTNVNQPKYGIILQTVVSCQPKPSSRQRSSLCYDADQHRLIVFGGQSSLLTWNMGLRDTWMFDFTTAIWSPLGSLPGTVGSLCQTNIVNDKVLLLDQESMDRHVFSIALSSLYATATSNIQPLQLARSSVNFRTSARFRLPSSPDLVAFCSKDRQTLVMILSEASATTNNSRTASESCQLWTFDWVSSCWCLVNSSSSTSVCPAPKRGASCVMIDRDRLAFISGVQPEGFLSTLDYEFSFTKHEWRIMATSQLREIHPIANACCFVSSTDSLIFVIGGRGLYSTNQVVYCYQVLDTWSMSDPSKRPALPFECLHKKRKHMGE